MDCRNFNIKVGDLRTSALAPVELTVTKRGIIVRGFFFDPATGENSSIETGEAAKIYRKRGGMTVILDVWGNEFYPKDQLPEVLDALWENSEVIER